MSSLERENHCESDRSPNRPLLNARKPSDMSTARREPLGERRTVDLFEAREPTALTLGEAVSIALDAQRATDLREQKRAEEGDQQEQQPDDREHERIVEGPSSIALVTRSPTPSRRVFAAPATAPATPTTGFSTASRRPIRAWLIAAGRRNDAEVCDRLCARTPRCAPCGRGRRGLPARDHDRDRGGVTRARTTRR